MGSLVLHGSSNIVCTCKSCSDADTYRKALDDDDNLIGVIVCKLEPHRGGPKRGYIAMLATRKDYRGHGIATSLVKMAIEKMTSEDADEVGTITGDYALLATY